MTDTTSWFDFKAQRAKTMAAWQAASWPDVAAFIGPNAQRFEPTFGKLKPISVERPGKLVLGWCWPAFLFGFAWFLYRKMYAAGISLLLIPIGLSLIFGSAGGGAAGFHVAISMFSKSLYLQHCVAKVGRLKQARAEPAAIVETGGVSIPAGIAGGLILSLALASMLMAP